MDKERIKKELPLCKQSTMNNVEALTPSLFFLHSFRMITYTNSSCTLFSFVYIYDDITSIEQHLSYPCTHIQISFFFFQMNKKYSIGLFLLSYVFVFVPITQTETS